MEPNRIRVIIIGLLLLLTGSNPVKAGKDSSIGRKIVNKWGNAVITVKLVVKYKVIIQGKEINKGETKIETIATIIDPSGLTIIPLSVTNPFGFLEHMEEDYELKWETKVIGLKMRLYNGKELPAKIILRDKELDLAFIGPMEKQKEQFPCIKLSDYSGPDILDRVLVLSRLGRLGGWVISASLTRIKAVINKPRIYYVPQLERIKGNIGAPVFSLDGKIVGILGVKRAKFRGIKLQSIFENLESMRRIPIIIPAYEILPIIKQIPKEWGK